MTIETPHTEWRRDQPVIDMHTHLSVDHLDEAIEIMDRVGIDKLADISASNYGDQFHEKLAAFSGYDDRFALFGGFDFEEFGTDGWAERECDRMERYVDAGAIGFKIHKALGLEYEDQNGDLIAVDDERLSPLFEKAAQLDTVMAFHIADPKAFFEPLEPENERWAELEHNPQWHRGDRDEYPSQWWQLVRQLERQIERHPETTILGVHWGCAAEQVGYVADVMRQNPNYVVDVSARLGEIGRHRPDLVRDVFVEFQDRVLFGTDLGVRDMLMLGAPQDFDPDLADAEEFYDAHWHYFETDDEAIAHPTPIQGDWAVDAVELPREVLRKFYVDNAQRHLGL